MTGVTVDDSWVELGSVSLADGDTKKVSASVVCEEASGEVVVVGGFDLVRLFYRRSENVEEVGPSHYVYKNMSVPGLEAMLVKDTDPSVLGYKLMVKGHATVPLNWSATLVEEAI